MAESLHGYARKLQRAKAAVGRSALSRHNKHAILAFADYCFSEGLSVARVEKYVCHLRQLASFFERDFRDASRTDVERLVRKVQLSSYSEWTKHDLRVTIKKLYRWLRRSSGDPPETAWIRVGNPRSRRRIPEEILSEEDVAKLIDACYTLRDKALVSVLYESGCRIGELASMRIKHVVAHPHGYRLIVSGKTGTRRLLVICSAPYLIRWLNAHPQKGAPDSFMWITNDHTNSRLSYSRMTAIITTAARRARLTKKVNPHAFRHSRATHLANSLTEAQMNEFFGWVQGSDMPSIYVHLSGRDVDNALLKACGISPGDEHEHKDSKFRLKKCPRCSVQNAPTNMFCNSCGGPLDENAARELMKLELDRSRTDHVMDKLALDTEFLTMLLRKVRELASPGD